MSIWEPLWDGILSVIKVYHLFKILQVEKARERLAHDKRTLYVAEASVIEKMKCSDGNWRNLLVALGFRFEKAHSNLPDSVFFPTQEYLSVLNAGCNTLYAFLGEKSSFVSRGNI